MLSCLSILEPVKPFRAAMTNGEEFGLANHESVIHTPQAGPRLAGVVH